ncbi:MAG: SIMPL domain-containing protein [Firmicutes bacterium]|nr:SIMPL domain-containing protein [Bacillota bacterium]
MYNKQKPSRFRLDPGIAGIIKSVVIGAWVIAAICLLSIGIGKAANLVINGLVSYKTIASGGITATGSASRDFLSDQVTWNGSFSCEAATTQEAYGLLKENAGIVRKYLLDNGVHENEITFLAVNIEQKIRNEYADNGAIIGSYPDGYKLTQSVFISSGDVDKIENISRSVTELIDSGVNLVSDAPNFYYTKLDQLKLDMIRQATANAKERIDIIAESSGSRAGKLLNASLGVFQITALNSASEEFSSYGTLNTWSKWKTASVTVKLYYAVE